MRRPTSMLQSRCNNGNGNGNGNGGLGSNGNGNGNGNGNSSGYAIIGDTAAATLYARRLLANGVTNSISLINEGADNTNADGLTDPDFVVRNNRTILRYLTTEQIYIIPSAEDQCDSDDGFLNLNQIQIIQYNVGAGPLGDFISAYHIPRLGPWFTQTTNGRLERFLSASTVRSPLNSQEMTVATRLSNIWGIPITSNMVVRQPSISNTHYEFILPEADGMYSREIFMDQYQVVSNAPNGNYVTETTSIQIAPSSGGLYDITTTGQVHTLNDVRLVWRTNPYTYLRISSEAGLDPGTLYVPTFYRALISIPIGGTGAQNATGATGTGMTGPTGMVCFPVNGGNGPEGLNIGLLMQLFPGLQFSTNGSSSRVRSSSGNCKRCCDCPPEPDCPPGTQMVCHCLGGGTSGMTCFVGLYGITGVDLSELEPSEDLLTTHIAFSLYDVNNPRSSSLAWLLQTYTTPEDLSVVQPEGKFADEGRTLLIVEGVCTKNKRRARFNTGNGEVIVNHNDSSTEEGYLRQFAKIVASIYNAYTGAFISLDSLVTNSNVCSPNNGTCRENSIIVDYSLRESPMVTILETASNMYGIDIYPNLSRTN